MIVACVDDLPVVRDWFEHAYDPRLTALSLEYSPGFGEVPDGIQYATYVPARCGDCRRIYALPASGRTPALTVMPSQRHGCPCAGVAVGVVDDQLVLF